VKKFCARNLNFQGPCSIIWNWWNLVGHKSCMDTTLGNRQWSSTLCRKI